jgi:sucrose-6-phosphate hydrolase SacC (GH32 family)
MKRTFILAILLLYLSIGFAKKTEKNFLITKKYLNYPIEMRAKKVMVDFMIEGEKVNYTTIRLAEGKPEYWVFTDVSAFIGKELTLVFDKKVKSIDEIFQSDSFKGEENLYKEKYRPQFHFSSRRGWNNDPNGLVYHNGEYHLYYQHNPYDTQWGNMHWGHAVSSDLVHWKELPVALVPDEHGTMYSGSAVIDKNNTSGWGKDVLVAAYTADNRKGLETQCIAYSTDNGRTFTKYEKNPVIDSKEKWQSSDTRDPKVFWYEPNKEWVMALFERNGISIYTSKNIKDWNYESHTTGFWECPELFELPVDGDENNKKWVMYGASGTYLIGSFDGKKFSPEAGKYHNTFGNQYASQTYNNEPSGRRVQIGWGRGITNDGMPFGQMMCFPTELTLRSTNEGPRLFSEPVKEIEKLHEKAYKWNNLSVEEANNNLDEIKGDLIHLKTKIEIIKGVKYEITYHGNTLVVFDGNFDLFNKHPYTQPEPGKFVFEIEMLIDKSSVEVFVDNGKMVDVSKLAEPKRGAGLRIKAKNDFVVVHELEVYELKSVW